VLVVDKFVVLGVAVVPFATCDVSTGDDVATPLNSYRANSTSTTPVAAVAVTVVVTDVAMLDAFGM
jgi:hypothetical protein